MQTYAIVRDPLMQQLIPQGQLRPLDQAFLRQLRAQQDAIEPVAYTDAIFDAVKETTGSTAAALAATSFSPSTVVKGLRKAPYALGVVKNPGGNWLEETTDRARRNYGLISDQDDTITANLNRFIDKKIIPYIKNDMATMRDPLRKMAEEHKDKQAKLLTQIDAQISKVEADKAAYLLTMGANADPAMTTRSNAKIHELLVKRHEISSRQPLHVPIGPEYDWVPATVETQRVSGGFPAAAVAKSEQAVRWENKTDSALSTNEAGLFGEGRSTRHIRNNPWLLNVDPKTPVHNLIDSEALGFDHLIHELTQATHPTSDLPDRFRIGAEQLSKLSLSDAVSRVADINAWRMTQRHLADQAAVGNAATKLIREFSTNNPKGISVRQLVLPTGDIDATTAAKQLDDALRNEGTRMGHSVAGYRSDALGEGIPNPRYGHGGWDGLIADKARLYSFRDALGVPGATIEVEVNKGGLPNITQIKGPGNLEVSPEYTHFIKDFLNNPPEGIAEWGRVADLRLAGLRSSAQLWNEREMAAIRKAGINPAKYLSKDEFMEIKRKVWPYDLTDDFPWNTTK